MSSLTHINAEFDSVRIECADDDATIWVRTRHDTVSLALDAAGLDRLEAVIAECRTRLVGVTP